MDNRPIGVFDSGLGGVSVVKELIAELPHEDIVYFGDTGRVPYGTRSKQTINKYAMQDIRFLLSKDVKMLIAACGTISANLDPAVSESLPVPYLNVVLPSSQAACSITKTGKIGVIATTASIRSGAYGRTMRSIRPDAVVVGNACPLFVPLVENGFIQPDNSVTRSVAEQYLAPFRGSGVDTLILGCTHFPVISSIIRDIVGEEIALINPGVEIAKQVSTLLTRNDLLCNRSEDGRQQYYVSDNPESFGEIASFILGSEIKADVSLIDVDSL